MDLVYTRVRKFYEIGSFNLPSSIIELFRLDRAFDSVVDSI